MSRRLRITQQWLLIALPLIMNGCAQRTELPTAAAPSSRHGEAPARILRRDEQGHGSDHSPRGHDAIIDEAKWALGALLSGEQAYYQKSALFGSPTFLNVANAEEAYVELGVVLEEPGERWTFAVTDASATGFVATATGRSHTRASKFILTLRHVRGQPVVLTVERRQAR